MNVEDLMGNEDAEQAPIKKTSPLVSLEADLKLYAESIREVAVEIMVEGISLHPIFVAHQHKVTIGELILDREELNTTWNIQASTLDEFVEKGIIHPDKKAAFLKSYKKPEDHMCIFVIVPEGANFVYFPYPASAD